MPTLQLLHCLTNAADGGESGLLDGFRAAALLRSEHAAAFACLTSTPVTFGYSDTTCELRATRPMIGTDPAGRIREIRYNSRSMQPLRPRSGATPEQAAGELRDFYLAYRAFASILLRPALTLRFSLQPGDCVVFDNTRVLHSRTGFAAPDTAPAGLLRRHRRDRIGSRGPGQVRGCRDRGYYHRGVTAGERLTSQAASRTTRSGSALLVPEFVAGTLDPSADPNWAASGARTAAEYGFWSGRVCGLACLRMILAARGLAVPPMMRLVEQALECKAYIPDGDRVIGLICQPFADWVEADYGVGVTVVPGLSLGQICASASPATPVIASVHCSIRWPDSTPPHAGGHLVLVTGPAAACCGCTTRLACPARASAMP